MATVKMTPLALTEYINDRFGSNTYVPPAYPNLDVMN